MKEVHIFYSKIREQPTPISLKEIPENILAKRKKYIKWQDRELNIIGKLLLIEGLKLYKFDVESLEKLKYTTYGKPYLDLDLDFNISHSGEYVICALTKGMQLGVDIEQIKTIDFNSFSEIFNENEFIDITTSKEAEKTFYKYWTLKESVVKAIGKGLSIPLKDVKINKLDQACYYKNETWHTQNLEINNLYAAHIATDYKQIKLNYHSVDFYEKEEAL